MPENHPEHRTGQRKLRHIEACLDPTVDRGVDSFAGWKLRYTALPEMALEDVRLECEFAGKAISAPLIIASMTGGAGEPFTAINRNLAIAAEALQIPLGLGSMRVALEDPAARESFRVRQHAPTAPIIANLGLVSFNYGLGMDDVRRVLDWAEPDALALHLNALQEVIQEGGDTNFRRLFGVLEKLLAEVPVPIYVKECGGGIAPELVARLAGMGVPCIDVSGNDGTSWAAVEALASNDPSLGDLFRDFGLPTAWILERLPAEGFQSSRIVASGGIRNGVQAAKALALGADYVSVARPFLAAAMASAEAAQGVAEGIIQAMRIALFLCGVRTPEQLGRAHLLRVGS